MLNPLLDLLWPPLCSACEAAPGRRPLCPPCEATLVSGLDGACPGCGGVYLTPPVGGGDHRCGACLTKDPPWVRAVGAYAYGGALRDAIVRWKSRPDHTLSPAMTRLMIEGHAEADWAAMPPTTRVLPVPSPPGALRRRGFNPAGLLARSMASHFGWRLITGLTMTSGKGSSRGVTRVARARRLQGVFHGDPRVISGAPVLLVDDVMTTGATARAAARACARAGAQSVAVAVLARAPLDG
jgi:predicted amidophosphoribosyltransferase